MYRFIHFSVFFILFAFRGIPALALCAGPLVGDRPDFTESAETVVHCRVQFESGYTFSRNGDTDEHALGEILARVRLADTAELRLGFNSYLVTRNKNGGGFSGLDDTSIGAKIRLPSSWCDNIPRSPMAAVIFESSLPTGGREYAADGPEPVAKLALAWELGDRAALGSNLNLAYPSGDGGRFAQLGASLSLGVALAEKIGGYGEVFSFLPGSRGGGAESFFNAGLTCLVRSCLQLDARLGFGLDGASPGLFAGFGFIRRW